MCTQQQRPSRRHPEKKKNQTAFPLPSFNPSFSIPQPTLLHLAAEQAIHPFPTTVVRELLNIPSPFLSPGDFPTGSSTLLQQEVAHFCRNLLSKDSRGPTQHTTMGSSSSLHHSTAECGILGTTVPSWEEILKDPCWEPLYPPGKRFLRILVGL